MKQPELGYYKVGDQVFQSKIKACIYASQSNQDPEWIFNNEVFSAFDWSVEPEESLDTLYQQRARELREQYDYIAILYSAGSDSNNILESFLSQNLHVDELINVPAFEMVHNYKKLDFKDKSADNAQYAEFVLQTIPRLQEIKTKYPKIKITIKDMTSQVFDRYKLHKDGSWIENQIEWLNPVQLRWDITKSKEFDNILEKYQKSCLILGCEKPRTGFDIHNNFHLIFHDTVTTYGPKAYLTEYNNVNLEFFYWHPSCTKMMSKQAHIIKKFVESRPDLHKFWELPLNEYKFKIVQEPILRNLIYTTWHEGEWYQAEKPMGIWLSQYDSWFLNSRADDLNYFQHVWKDGINYVHQHANKFIKYYEGQPDGLKTFGHRYKMGTFNPQVV